MAPFTIYPAIDLKEGRVVRLKQGDRNRLTAYHDRPAAVAERWLEAGARWLHVVNLDGAFGDAAEGAAGANTRAIAAILKVSGDAQVQLGGGLRTAGAIRDALDLGVNRVIVGTVALEQPALLSDLLDEFGPERIVAAIDARQNRVRVRGWTAGSDSSPLELSLRLRQQGVERVVFTNIARDGVGRGVDVAASLALARQTGLEVIASGGVAGLDDVRAVKAAGLPGLIIGRALYEGAIDLQEALRC